MLDGRSFLPIAVSLCLAASGCQDASPASATSLSNGKSPTDRPATDAGSGNRTPADSLLGEESNQTVEPRHEREPRPLPAVPHDGRAIAITFDDLQLEMKEDSVFDPAMLTARVKQLDGQRVRIRGFIFPAIFQQTGITRFPLIKNTQCKFGPGGLAHHIILVDLQPGLSTSFTVRPIAVEGLLTIRPFNGPDGKTWTIYHMAGDKID